MAYRAADALRDLQVLEGGANGYEAYLRLEEYLNQQKRKEKIPELLRAKRDREEQRHLND